MRCQLEVLLYKSKQIQITLLLLLFMLLLLFLYPFHMQVYLLNNEKCYIIVIFSIVDTVGVV